MLPLCLPRFPSQRLHLLVGLWGLLWAVASVSIVELTWWHSALKGGCGVTGGLWGNWWAVAPGDDPERLLQWWGWTGGVVIPTLKTENSLLLTANLFLLCSTAYWVFQCQRGASRLFLFPPAFEWEHLYWGHGINSIALSLWLWECFCKQGFLYCLTCFSKHKCFVICLLWKWIGVQFGQAISMNFYSCKSIVNCQLL